MANFLLYHLLLLNLRKTLDGTDFINMIFSFCNLGSQQLSEDEVQSTKRQLTKLKEERSTLLKQNKILKSKKIAVSQLSSISDKIAFEEKVNQLEKINNKITELRKERNSTVTRKAKWETTIKELRSLNRTIDCGELRCMECDSTNISFSTSKKSSYTFDVSTVDMRTEIIKSINEKIDSYDEEVEKITSLISKEQKSMQELMSDDAISLESIVAYKNKILDSSKVEKRIHEIDEKIQLLANSLQANESSTKETKENQIKLLNNIITLMQTTYHLIDRSSNSHIDGLFTKRDEIFSGSEATVFHLSKLYALQKNINHKFPIIVDSFRAEDLSTPKEQLVLDLFQKIPNQKIFTTTLKTQELGKYDSIDYLNSIDYKDHEPSKMLNSTYNLKFRKLIEILGMLMNRNKFEREVKNLIYLIRQYGIDHAKTIDFDDPNSRESFFINVHRGFYLAQDRIIALLIKNLTKQKQLKLELKKARIM